jgi:dethiobiotin synthetase
MNTGVRSRRWVIVGAGTGVGKTHLGVALARALALQAEQVVALKPIESGVVAGVLSDAAQLATASSFHVKHPPPYVFTDPISPHLAARRSGRSIDLRAVVAWIDAHICPWVLVETAGGLLSPLGPGITNLDLAQAVRPDGVLLVAQDRLGVLHEVTACRVALRTLASELREVLVVLQAPSIPDASTGTNAAELSTLGLVDRAFAIPRGTGSDVAVAAAAAEVVGHLRGLPEPGVCFT